MRKISKIMLVTPRYTLFEKDIRRCVTPLGIAYLGSVLENKNEVRILDIANDGYYNIKDNGEFSTYGLDDKIIEKEIINFNPDMFGVSCIFSTQYENAKETLKLVKRINDKIITFIGGSHPTYSIKETLGNKDLDYIILGEGELPLTQFIETMNNNGDISKIDGLANKDFINLKRQYIKNLDDIPFPAWHLLNMENYFKINTPQNPRPKGKRVAQIMTSRGCSARCVFCTTTNFWGNMYRGRSAENVIGELRDMKEKYDIDEVQFTDDNLTLDKERAMKIFDGMKDLKLNWCTPQGVAVWTLDNEMLEKMKESGCYQLTFGIESGNQYVLSKLIKKPLNLKKVKPLVNKAHELGIKVHSFNVCGIPEETIEQMYDTFNFSKDCGFDSASFHVASPIIGSELLKICKENNYLISNDYTKRTQKIGNITTKDFTAEQIEELTTRFNREFNAKEEGFDKEKY
jgi:radical SAM superfamily enzyme YgiQ (UPF0313 family)